jgi:integrase
MPNVEGNHGGSPEVAVGVQGMRQTRSGGEMPKVRRKYLSPDEARRVIDAAGKVGRQRERNKLLLMMMYRHGLRVSEAVDLRWTDFDLDAPKDRPFHVRRLKGSKDSTHTLEPDTVRALKRLKEQSDGPHVFRSEQGKPMSVDSVQLICKRAGEVAGLGFRCHPHMLRHAVGFYFAEKGADTRLIQDFLGHRDIKNTVIYTETSQRRLAAMRAR